MKSKSLQLVCLIAGMVLVFSLFPLRAEKVDADKAGRLAQHFVESKRQLPAGDAVRLKYIATQKQRNIRTAQSNEAVSPDVQDTVFYYVFNVNADAGGGFVIVSGDDAVTPVLGYSDSGSYDENNLPPNLVYWMDYLQQEIRWAISQNLPQNDTMRQKWDVYLNGIVTNAVTVVTPLISTTWGQNDPYWKFCPEVGSRHSVTGCAATAMAQIMNYHRHPARGTGQSAAYTTRTSGISIPSVNLEVNYDWGNMLNSYRSGNPTDQQKEAVAILMYHCGVAVQMDYSPDASGAYSQDVPGVLSKHFGYATGCSYVTRPNSNSTWETTIKAQLDAGLPVYYSGHGSDGGHAFVCDGYRDDGTFHFNWGWDGRHDEWFVTTALNTANGSFNSTQGIVINIRPAVPVPATGVSLNKTSATVLTGNTEQLTATVTPNNATNKNVTWNSSNTAAATVNGNGLITAVSEGTSTITATTQDGGMKATCLVTVIQSQNTNANLSALTVNPGELTPAFNANVTDYTVNVASQISTITISATAANSRATVAGTGVRSLNVGNNTISVTVTAQNGTVQKTYTITVTRAAPGNIANLSALSVNRGTLTPAFDAAITDYNVDVDNNTASITVQATTEDASATVTGTGVHSLITGINTLRVEVTAADQTTKKTYTITVVRAPAISADPYEPNDTPDQASVLPVLFLDDAATVKTTGANFHTDTDVDYYKIDLPSGYQYKITARLHDSWDSNDGNTYTVDAVFRYSMDGDTWTEWFDDVMTDNITIPNGGTVYFHAVPYFTGYMGTYLLDITMVRSLIEGYNNADLSSLSVSPATLTPAFNAATTVYTVHADNSVTGITVSATPVNPCATVTGTGIHSLDVGSNIISVAVTAQDGKTGKTYSIVVIREMLSGEDDNFRQALTAYPNPATDRVTISGMKGAGILTVFDAAGRRWIQQNINFPEETVIVSSLPEGSYFVQIVEGKNVKTIKLIINN